MSSSSPTCVLRLDRLLGQAEASDLPSTPPKCSEVMLDFTQPDVASQVTWRFGEAPPSQAQATREGLRLAVRSPDDALVLTFAEPIPTANISALSLELMADRGERFRLGWLTDHPSEAGQTIGNELVVPLRPASLPQIYTVHTHSLRAWGPRLRALHLHPSDAAGANVVLRVVRMRDARSVFAGAAYGPMAYSIGDDLRSGLYTHTPVTLTWQLRLPAPHARLMLALGSLPGQPRLHYRVTLEAEGAAPVAMLDLQPDPVDGWHDVLLDLDAWAGRTVRLSLSAASQGETAVALWAYPTVFALSDEPRRLILYVVDCLRADVVNDPDRAARVMPALHAFSQDAALFTDAIAPANWTRSSVVSMLSGEHLAVHQVFRARHTASSGLPLITEALQETGFHTLLVAQDNPNIGPASGIDRGFDCVLFDANKGHREDRDSETRLRARFLPWLKQALASGRDLFVYLHAFGGHDPYFPERLYPEIAPDVRPEEVARYGDREHFLNFTRPADIAKTRQLYECTLRDADATLASVVEMLREADALEATTLIVTADHGEMFNEHGVWRHASEVLYQGVIRVPLVVGLPGRPAAGRRTSQPVSLIDLAPTLLDAADLPTFGGLPGHSLQAILDGGQPPDAHRARYTESERQVAMLVGPWKVIAGRYLLTNTNLPLWRPLLRQIRPGVNTVVWLHHLRFDPSENINLALPLWFVTIHFLRAMRAWLARQQATAERIQPADEAPIEVDVQVEERLRALGYID
jgi:arylsulfatase A-like enzyme